MVQNVLPTHAALPLQTTNSANLFAATRTSTQNTTLCLENANF
jgi:hypothetical protein